jgi:O-glycosyl hydrolase
MGADTSNSSKVCRFFLMAIGVLPCSIFCAGTVTVDFSKQTGQAYPGVFGGNSYNDNAAICTMHKQAGFNVVRMDGGIDGIVPTSTVDNYKNNINNAADTSTWRFRTNFDPYVAAGLKLLYIIDYCPPWLSYTGTNLGVPKDWDVWEDIIKKIYRHYQNKITYVEVWNEPDWVFFDVSGSPYSKQATAYKELYRHTMRAIRSINSTVSIGGYVSTISWTDTLLNDTEIAPNVDFLSYHFYSQNNQSCLPWKTAAARHNKPDMPIFITEWNSDASYTNIPLNSQAPEAISYVGKILANQIKEGVSVGILFCMAKMSDFYTVDANNQFVPKVSTYRLMSVQLGLGKGQGTVCQTTSSGVTVAFGAVNVNGESVVCAVNDAGTADSVNVVLNNVNASGTVACKRYEASPSNDATAFAEQKTLTLVNNSATVSVTIPAHSVAGLVLATSSAIITKVPSAAAATVRPHQGSPKQFDVSGRAVSPAQHLGIAVKNGKTELCKRSSH